MTSIITSAFFATMIVALSAAPMHGMQLITITSSIVTIHITLIINYVADIIAKDQGLPLSPFVCQFIPVFLQPALCQKNKGM